MKGYARARGLYVYSGVAASVSFYYTEEFGLFSVFVLLYNWIMDVCVDVVRCGGASSRLDGALKC